MDFFSLLTMIGGLALFLYGMHMMGEGLSKASGGRLESILEKLTSKPITAVLVGTGVTAVIQSSSATTVMVVGFVNSGIMKLEQAVGIIMGGAFTPIVNSLVNDIVMPCVGMVTGGVDFSDKKIILKAADEAAEIAEVSVGYGNLIQVILNFLIISACVFALIKAINKLKRKEEPKPEEPKEPEPTKEELLLAEIRDLLKNDGVPTAPEEADGKKE